MNIGFDAKRAYHNNTGLGYYSRTLINLLADRYPEHAWYLFNPKPSKRYQFRGSIHEILPQGAMKMFPSVWRSSRVTADLRRLGIDLYHGLSHEIPVGIRKSGTRSVVTIHDLIHERFPEQYKAIDRRIYTSKYKYACANADHVIAISQQTKDDIIQYYHTPAEKITVCYQSCSPLFGIVAGDFDKQRIRMKYSLPEHFFLSVGTINDRKNLLNVCKAVFLLREELPVPLVVIGRGSGTYFDKVKDFILQHHLERRIIFLSEDPKAKEDKTWLVTEDLPVIYQLATAMVYPSFFEGFGAPVMEALWSRLPVITSNVSCLPEVGGDAAYYVDPNSSQEIAEGMRRIFLDKAIAKDMQAKGLIHAQDFTPEKYAASVMEVYERVMQKK